VKDPLNVVFYGLQRHNPSNEAYAGERYMGLFDNTINGDGNGGGRWPNHEGTTQSVVTHGNCQPQTTQVADDAGFANRYHMRLFDSCCDQDKTKRGCAGGDAHHDGYSPDPNCSPFGGHVSSSYNQPRDLIYQMIYNLSYQNPGPPGSQYYRHMAYAKPGNSLKIRQCDGRHTGGDGSQLWIHLASTD
jgi:hypothetical protein